MLQPFAVGVCVGFGTILSCYTIGHALVTQQRWCPWSWDTVITHLGHKILRCLRLSATYEPPVDTMDLIRKSVGGKIQAASRQRPHPLQLERALSLRAKEVSALSARRRTAHHVYDEVVTAYNKLERVRSCKLSSDETSCVKLIARETPATRALLEVIWGEDKMQCTAVPLVTLASKFLQDDAEVPVSRSTNPEWHGILQVTPEKRYQFLFRCWSRFQSKVQDTINKGKNPNLRNFAASYREVDTEMTWRMVCLYMTKARPRLLTLVTQPSDIHTWDAQFNRGALDNALCDKCRALDPSFSVDDISFVRNILQGTMANWTPDKLSEALSSAGAQKVQAEFNLVSAEIRAEGLAWSQWLLRRAEHQESELTALTRARERADRDVEAAVTEHCAAHFVMESPKERSSMALVMSSALVAFCDAPPKKVAENCLRLNVLRLDARS